MTTVAEVQEMASPGTSRRAFAVVATVLLTGFSLSAQSVDSMRASYMLTMDTTVQFGRLQIPIYPGSSSGTPTAYGAEFGDIFFGGEFQARTRYTSTLPFRDRIDGSVYGGFGLGNPRSFLGIELVATSFTTIRHGFFRESSFSFKIHRQLPGNFAIAYGWEDAIHSTGTDGGSSMYGVLTSDIRFREDYDAPMSAVTLSAGVGNGRFQTEQAFYAGKHGVNGFGSMGLHVVRPLSLIADWTGQDLMLGASIVPFRKLPLIITPAFADVTGSAGDGARFVMGAGFDFNLLQH